MVVLNAEKSFVQSPETKWSEVDIPNAVVDLLETDVLTSESVGDAHPVLIPANSTVATDEPDLEVPRVLDGWQRLREAAVGGSIDRSGRFLTEGLMGPFEVVLLAEGVEAPLLSLQVAGGWTSRLGLERSVHPLVSTVLLRVGGFDELGVNPETDPPDGESREATERGGGEGYPVVGADDPRKTVLLKEPQEDRACQADRGGRESLTTEEKSAVAVDEGQGEAIDAIPGPELPLEVGGPDIVRVEHRGQRFSRMAGEPTASSSHDETVALENIVAGGARGPVQVGMPSGEHAKQFLGSPGRVVAPAFDQDLHDGGRALVRAGAGLARAILQTRSAFFPVAMEPLVGRLPADTKPSGQLGAREELTLIIGDEPNSLVHGRGLLPRHRGTSCGAPSLLEVSPMYLDYCVTHVP